MPQGALAVQKAGYKTNSKDFYGVVATAVREGGFEKLSRGVYKLGAARKLAAKAGRKAGRKKAGPKA